MKKIFIMFVALILALPLLFTHSFKTVNAAYNSTDEFGGSKVVTNLNFELIKSVTGYSSTGNYEHTLLNFIHPATAITSFSLVYYNGSERVAGIRFYDINFQLSHSNDRNFYFYFPSYIANNWEKRITYYYNTEAYPANLNSLTTYIESIETNYSTWSHNPLAFSIANDSPETKQSLFNKVHAKMQEAYQINLENTNDAPVFVKGGSLIELPTPTKTGHTFGGWFVDAALTIPFTTSIMPGENITIYAKWTINNYLIYLVNQGIVLMPPLSVQYNAQIPVLPTLTWTGHTFAGWFTDTALTTPFTTTTMPAENLTAYAKWTITETGEPVDPVEPTDPTSPEEPCEPTAPGRESLFETLKRKMIDPFNEKALKPIYRAVIKPLADLLSAPAWAIWAGLTFIVLVLIPAIFKKLLKNNKKTNEQ